MFDAMFLTDFFGAFQFQRVFLVIVKGQGDDSFIAFYCPEQTGSAVLAAAENNHSGFLFLIPA